MLDFSPTPHQQSFDIHIKARSLRGSPERAINAILAEGLPAAWLAGWWSDKFHARYLLVQRLFLEATVFRADRARLYG